MEDEPDNHNFLLQQLESALIVDVLGVVAPNGVNGVRIHDDDLWTALFTFDAWRIIGSNIHTEMLNIRQEVVEEELHKLQNTIAPYTVICIKAQVVKSAFGIDEAYLKSFVRVDTSDAELNYHLEELQKPVTFEDSFFGTFTLERPVDWFAAEVIWEGNPISLHLSDFDEVQECLKTAHTIWRNQSYWYQKIRDYAVQELLNLKNNDWLDEDEVELSPDKFKDRMILESIKVCPNGSFDFYFDDGDLFWGHSIEISGSLLEGMTYANIFG